MSTAPRAFAAIDQRLDEASKPLVDIPQVASFEQFLREHARVRKGDGSYCGYSFERRAPLRAIVELISKIMRNCLHGETVEIDGQTYKPGALKGSTVTIGGGAQFGKSVLELNLMAHCTGVEFVNFGYYTPDRELLQVIVDSKFRPDVMDQIPWISEMVQVGKVENASGKAVNRKNSFQVSSGKRKAFGHFVGLQKPTTTITLDAACLDEVDDIPKRNIGYVNGRMTNSNLRLTVFIGTMRIHGAGQNARYENGTQGAWHCACPSCHREWCIEEQFPGIVRIALDGVPQRSDPKIDETMEFDPQAVYYTACPECGTKLDRHQGRYIFKHPERAKQLNWSFRISQLAIDAIGMDEICGAWFAALQDPTGEAMVAVNCDRLAMPKSFGLQPITPDVITRSRRCGTAATEQDLALDHSYAMAFAPGQHPRVAGLDTGPRCWLMVDEVRSPAMTLCAWAEMMASGQVMQKIPGMMVALGISCLFIDAAGEPELTKQLVLKLNGLDAYKPPARPVNELKGMTLANIGQGVTWDGTTGAWRGIRAAAVLFVAREAKGVEQDIGVTVDGHIYPLIKCNRAESIQTAVNDFLTPREGFVEVLQGTTQVRMLPRQRLPRTAIGPGAPLTTLETHLLNLRKARAADGTEDWVDGVENHLGLAKTYARLAAMFQTISRPKPFAFRRVQVVRNDQNRSRMVML